MRSPGHVMGMAGTAVWLMAALASAQSTTSSTETKTFEVVSVEGNELVVKLPEGTKALTVPEDFRLTVDGRSMAVAELKPGMKGTATITTTTTMTPVTVTEVKNGEVLQVSASTMVVRTAEGIRSFSQGDVDKRGVTIMRAGRAATISDFHGGDRISATIITTQPPKLVTEREVAATLAPDVPPAAIAAPDLAPPVAAPRFASAAPPAASVRTSGTGQRAPGDAPAPVLPATASSQPMFGLGGVVLILLGLALAYRRRAIQ